MYFDNDLSAYPPGLHIENLLGERGLGWGKLEFERPPPLPPTHTVTVHSNYTCTCTLCFSIFYLL